MALCSSRQHSHRSSLHRQIILPYVLLVVLMSIALGWVSYQAAEDAVTALSHRVLQEMVQRVGSATEQQLAGALTALHSVDPDPATIPRAQVFPDDLAVLEARFWSASGLFMDLSNYVYFGGEDGRFVGVNRINKDVVELYLRHPGAARRHVYAVAAPGDRGRVLRTDDYDPRVRPWYGVAAAQDKPVWSPVYSDFTSREPTITLAKAVRRPDGTLTGVMATDVTLKALTDFLRTLNVSEHGVAFVMDSEGYLVATSGSEPPFKMVGGVPERLRIAEMRTPLIRDAYAAIRDWKSAHGGLLQSPGFLATSGAIDIAAQKLGQRYGVDWITVVAVPRSDFMDGVTQSFIQGIAIAGICVVVALVLGLSILHPVLRDIRKLTEAAQRVGNGEPLPALDIARCDEIGQLATTFSEMEHNLRIDELTGVFNRASLIAQIGFMRRQLDGNAADRPHFALLFIDLDHFKKINDRYGHDAGDKVLATVAGRLKQSVRAYDVVARYGGDEFIVLLKGTTTSAETATTERKIRQAVEEPVQLEDGRVSVGASIGWAMFPADGEDVDTLLKTADKRMFDTKRSRKAAR